MAGNSGKKPGRIYFYPQMDIMLVMEVLQRNPYQHGNGVYTAIAAELRKNEEFRDVNPRALHERTDRLLKTYRSSQMNSMKRSGTEEEYELREHLLQDLSDLEKEWKGTLKRVASSLPVALKVRKKAVKLNTMEKGMQDNLGASMQPSSSTEAEPELNDVGAQMQLEEELGEDNCDQGGEDNCDQGDLTHADEKDLKKPTEPQPMTAVDSSVSWSSTMKYMRKKLEKLEKGEESKKHELEIKQQELLLKKEELEVRRLEATNERLRIEAQQRENQHKTEMEERRRQEEREDRNLRMDRQTKLMDAMLQLIQCLVDGNQDSVGDYKP